MARAKSLPESPADEPGALANSGPRERQEAEETARYLETYSLEDAYRHVWETLSRVDCTDYVEKKNGLSYLSWAWAYGILQEKFPGAWYEILADEHYANGSVMVRVDVMIPFRGHCLRRTMWLPVMDFKNKAMPNPDARSVSDTRMRCLTKCISMFGLGHYIYAGEDLPMEPVAAPSFPAAFRPTPERAEEITRSCTDTVGANAPMTDGSSQLIGEEMAHGGAKTVTEAIANLNQVEVSDQASAAAAANTKQLVVITTEDGAEAMVEVLLHLANSMHSNNLKALADFWGRNKHIVDVLDSKWNPQYQRLKAGFTAIRERLTAPTQEKQDG